MQLLGNTSVINFNLLTVFPLSLSLSLFLFTKKQLGAVLIDIPGFCIGHFPCKIGTVYFSNPASKTHRDQMTVKKSSNGGETWEIDTPIFGGPSAFSNLVPIGVPVSNSYGVVFENGEQVAYERISFAEVKILN